MEGWKNVYSLRSSELHSDKNNLKFEKPNIIGIMKDGKQIEESQEIKYLRLPKPSDYPLDLNKGFENYKFRPENKFSSNMDVITTFLSLNPDFSKKYTPNKTNHNFEVITHRGVLAELMATAYFEDIGNNLKVLAIKYKNKLFLMKGFRSLWKKEITSSHQFKFRQYIFTDDPDSEPDCNAPIDEKEQLYCIYQANLDNLNIVYSGEICGIKSDKKLENLNNLNQCTFVQTKVMARERRNVIIDVCMKAYLAGTEDLYLTCKNPGGFVTEPIQHFTIKESIKKAKWSPNAGVKFMHNFINTINIKMQNIDSAHICYEFNWDKKSACIESKLHEFEGGNSFLPEEFINYLNQ